MQVVFGRQLDKQLKQCPEVFVSGLSVFISNKGAAVLILWFVVETADSLPEGFEVTVRLHT